MLIKRLSGLVAGVFLAGIVCILASACAEQSSVKLLELNRQIVVLETGEEYELKVSILPTECADSAEWSSSDESVVTVESGLLRAAGEGDALITVTAGTKSASCSVTVVDDCVRVDSVESLRAAAEQLEEGDVILLEGGTYKLNRCLTLRDLSQVMLIGEEGVVIEKSDVCFGRGLFFSARAHRLRRCPSSQPDHQRRALSRRDGTCGLRHSRGQEHLFSRKCNGFGE